MPFLSGGGGIGPEGPQGIPGVDGTNGVDGVDGAQGPQGDPGIQGIQGPIGVTGNPGTNGIDGTDGIDGSQGIQGIQGIQGVSGPNIVDGTTASTLTGLLKGTGSLVAVESIANIKTNLSLVKGDVGLGNVDNTTDVNKPVSTATQTALNLKANIASPTFTGTVAGVTKAMVGLTSVDDTTDAGKPVSTAQQTALNLKANLASPSFTGNVTISANNIITDTTTGMQIGTGATQKLGFFGVTPAVRPGALTQTYSTTNTTHLALTSLAAPAGGTGTSAGGYNTAANRDLMITAQNAIRTDLTNLKNFVNSIVDQLQALGLLQ